MSGLALVLFGLLCGATGFFIGIQVARYILKYILAKSKESRGIR